MNDLFRDLTVGEARALNEAARLTCGFECTSQAAEEAAWEDSKPGR